ncbi:hypothetical protein VTN00DRAFT_10119 [Thermoascus crustaceus]|uniref:uncharacterized protein n=1 Tax=Thermoascus crustaceus TaxID=5088 RepID=UPI00374206B8
MVPSLLTAPLPRKRDINRKKERQRHLNNALVALPSARERSLTIPLPEGPQTIVVSKGEEQHQRTEKQLQSSFFAKLPPEIRTKIYTYALGGNTYKILKDDTARYVKWIAQGRLMLSLPRTCRRIYSETIDLLYSQNTFFFCDYDTILWFASTILPHRLAVIRSLEIEWDCICFFDPRLQPPPPYDRDTWFEVWRTLQAMPGLRELNVRIWNGPKMSAETEAEVFKPLTEIRGLEKFELELPWRYQGEGVEGHRDAPFKIRRVRRKYAADFFD